MSKELQVYFQKNDLFSEAVLFESAYQNLSEDRRNKVDACKTREGKLQRLAAGVLLEETLRLFGYEGDLVYEESPSKKPRLIEKDAPYFSISHTKDYVASVCGKRAVGVDVERIGRIRDAVVKRFFSENEKAMFATLEEEKKDIFFLVLWTVKEAITKCLDEALAVVCSSWDISEYYQTLLENQSLQLSELELIEILSEDGKRIWAASYEFDNHMISCVSLEAGLVRFEKGIDKLQ